MDQGTLDTYFLGFILHIIDLRMKWSGQCLAVGNTATDKLYKSVQPVPARVEEPVSTVRQSSSGVPRAIHPFPRCLKPAQESRLSKPAYYIPVRIPAQVENTINNKNGIPAAKMHFMQNKSDKILGKERSVSKEFLIYCHLFTFCNLTFDNCT